MSERVVISLASGADRAVVEAALRAAGAISVSAIDSLPDTLLATVEDADVDRFVGRAQHLAGVRHAERDCLRYSS
jgi:hypothetical protein